MSETWIEIHRLGPFHRHVDAIGLAAGKRGIRTKAAFLLATDGLAAGVDKDRLKRSHLEHGTRLHARVRIGGGDH